MLQLIHQHTKPQTITEQHKLVLELCALFARAREELDRFVPFCVGELGFAGEGVEVVDEGGEDLEVAGGGGEGLVQGVDAVFVLGLGFGADDEREDHTISRKNKEETH